MKNYTTTYVTYTLFFNVYTTKRYTIFFSCFFFYPKYTNYNIHFLPFYPFPFFLSFLLLPPFSILYILLARKQSKETKKRTHTHTKEGKLWTRIRFDLLTQPEWSNQWWRWTIRRQWSCSGDTSTVHSFDSSSPKQSSSASPSWWSL